MKNQAGHKRVVLELGGNAGVIVTPTANLEQAVSKCLSGAFAYAGQGCIHTQRIYVHQSVFVAFTEKFIQGAAKLRNGPPLDNNTDISSMIDEENAIRVEEWVNEAVSNGAKLLLGGQSKGTYFPPTALSNTTPNMQV